MNRQPEDASRLLAEYDALIALDAAARAARIAALATTEPALAASLRAMLGFSDRDAEPGGLGLQSLIDDLVSATAPLADATPPRIGAFVAQRLLGRGGMGEVWLAERDEGGFRQQVALKVLRRGMDSEDLRRRFVQERRILAALSHPNIARFIDGGIGADGAPWFAMEYVDGVPLSEHARARGLGVRERVALLADAAEAVAYAQNRLVVHRDLKPSNILVDGQGRVRLLDFGIAKLMDEAPDAGTTATGVRAMSPAYAAPEQILGEPVSAATDVFALGMVLYELLTGELPHQRSGASPETLAERVRSETPDRPSVRLRRADATSTTTLGADAPTAQRFARAIAGELDTIALTALRREPERRYASAAAFADDLRRWLDGRPVAAQADTATYRMRKFVARHRLAVGSASAVLLALIAGFGTALWQASVAREQARLAGAQAERASRVKEFLVSLFSEGERNSRPGERPRTPLELVDGGIDAARNELGADPPLQDDVLGDLIDIKVNLGAAAAALPLLDERIAWRRARAAPGDTRLADALGTKAHALFQQGRVPDAEPLLEEAIALLTAARGADSLAVAEQQNRLVRVRFAQSRFEEAEALMREVLRKTELGLGPAHTELALRLNNLALLQLRGNRPEEARATLQRSLAILETARGPNHASLAFPLTTLGDLERDLRNYDAAITHYARIEAILEREHGQDDPGYAVALNRLGDAQRRRRDFAAAAHTLERALGIQQRGKFAGLGDTYARLGDLATDQGRLADAEAWFRQAHAFQLSTQGERNLLAWTRLGQVSNALAAQQRYAEALAVRRETTRRLEALGTGAAREAQTSRFLEGVLERNAGDLDAGLEHQQAAYARILSLLAKDERRLAAYRVQLALTLVLRGTPADRDEAIALLAAAGPTEAIPNPSDRAHAVLAGALLSPAGAERDALLAQLDLLLGEAGPDSVWLARQREALLPASRAP